MSVPENVKPCACHCGCQLSIYNAKSHQELCNLCTKGMHRTDKAKLRD